VLGNAAFGEATPAPQFVAHQRFAAGVAARAPYWLKTLGQGGAPAESVPVPMPPVPEITVTDTRELDLGDRVLELRAWPTAHTDNDLTVLDRESGTMWLGDLVFAEHLPVLDGRLQGWRSVLESLRAMHPALAVPGHGPPIRDWPAGLRPTAAYLERLEHDVRRSLREGATLAQTVDRLGASPAGWELADTFHRRNITAAYAELEWSE
jgi:glyoxylase-like metal-dependent hydrolase (beta-lactamase superfamily II)